jgi:tetratricopeptide (TPR) repeat protein
MQRMDEVNAVLRMLGDPATSAVTLTGMPGSGKSTLAALLFRYLRKTYSAGGSHHMVWLRLNTYTTLPDLIMAILQSIQAPEPEFFALKPEQQISTLLRALRRSKESALIMLDQFELLLHPETNQGVAGRGTLSLFLDMLKTDLGTSRIILTSYHYPFERESDEVQARVRSYLVSRISQPEGVTLLQQRGVQGSLEDIKLVCQRCTGHAYALTLLSSVISLTHMPLSYLLNAPDYQPMWSGEITTHLCTALYHFFSPVQRNIVRTLSLFFDPVPLAGIKVVISNSGAYGQKLERELENLVRLGLVQVTESQDEQVGYELHSLLRMYVQEHYQNGQSAQNGSDSQAEGHTRIAGYYIQLARSTCPPIEKREGPQDVQPLISAIRHLCLAQKWKRASELLFSENLHQSLLIWGSWNVLVGLYSALLQGQLTRQDEATIASQIALLYGRLGEHQQSQRYFDQALGVQRQIGDAKGEIAVLINQGELWRMREDETRAQQLFEQALHLSEKAPEPSQRCVLLHNLGLLYHQQKRYDEAYRAYNEALQLAQQLRNQHYLGILLTNLGLLLFDRGMHKEALAVLLAAQQLREAQHDHSVAILEHFLSALEQRMGEEVYARMRQEALNAQQAIISRFIGAAGNL